MLSALFLLAALMPQSSDAVFEEHLGRVALAQVRRIDPRWHPDQRDCAGLIRFAYRQAFRAFRPERLARPLFEDARGAPADFADAQTLLTGSFVFLGRSNEARERLRTGDLVAFRQQRNEVEVAYHLMLVVRPLDKAHAQVSVVYHPGEPGAAVRVGALSALEGEAVIEWRPIQQNGAFLGYYRFKELNR